MDFSFIHIADIHLGRPFSDLSELNDKSEICTDACKKSFEKVIDLAISYRVDFVLIAGDSFDSDEHDLCTKLIFIRNLKKLADNGIKSYVICGNHDPVSMYKKYPTYFRFDSKYQDMINITGVTTDEHKFDYNPQDGITIHTISFRTEEEGNPALELAPANDKNFHIGLIHCDLDKTESKYAPVSREDLRKLGYDYYALGHIHIPEIKENNMVYAGTPQARTKKETGSHGCYYVKVKNNEITEKEFIETDFVRFYHIEIDCSELQNKIEIFEKILENTNQNNENLYEITLTGITKAYEELANTENLPEEYIENYNNNVYRINNETSPEVDESSITDNNGVIGIIAKSFDENSDINIENIYEKIAQIHESIYKKLGLDSESKEYLTSSLEDDKNYILENVKKEIKMLCKEIYNLEK